MSVPSVLAPVFVLVALIYVLLGGLIVARRAVRGTGGARDMALGRATQIGDSFRNQFELPVLFFALVALALIAHKADLVFVVLEWLFILSRLVHAAIHTTSNRQPLRGAAFAIGAAVLAIAWIRFAITILAGA